MSIINLVLGTVSAILLAILLNEVIRIGFKRTVQTVTYLPHFLSMVIVVGMAQNIFASNGPINQLLMHLHLIKEPIFFLGEGKLFWWLVGVINVWKEVGWNTIIYLAALIGISPELYEAAEVDGASRWKKIWHITLPGIRSTIVVLLIMNLGHILGSEFDRPFTLSNKLVEGASKTISIFVYERGIMGQQYALSTAVGLFQSVMCVIFLLASNALAKKFGERGVW